MSPVVSSLAEVPAELAYALDTDVPPFVGPAAWDPWETVAELVAENDDLVARVAAMQGRLELLLAKDAATLRHNQQLEQQNTALLERVQSLLAERGEAPVTVGVRRPRPPAITGPVSAPTPTADPATAPPTRSWAGVLDGEVVAAASSARAAMVAAESELVAAAGELRRRWVAEAVDNWHEWAALARLSGRRGVGLGDVQIDQAREEAADLAGRRAAAEIARFCGVSEAWVDRRVQAAAVLPDRLPAVWNALHGDQSLTGPGTVVDWDKAVMLHALTDHLDEPQARGVCARALARARALCTTAKLRAFTERAVAAADPDTHRLRVRQAIASRGVRFRSLGDGVAEMSVTSRADRIEAARAALDALTRGHDTPLTPAEGAHCPTPTTCTDPSHDHRTEAAVRADTVIDALLAAADAQHTPDNAGPASPGPVWATTAGTRIIVLVPLSALLGGDTPAELVGHGPIPAELARELARDAAHHATWRCAFTDDRPPPENPDTPDNPETPGTSGDPDDTRGHGSILGLGRAFHVPRYEPPGLLREFVELRDGTCRAPGCRRRAALCDADHTTPHLHGGATCDCNLMALCRHHHRLKHTPRPIPTAPTTERPHSSPPPADPPF